MAGADLAFYSTTSRRNRRNEVAENGPKAIFGRKHLIHTTRFQFLPAAST